MLNWEMTLMQVERLLIDNSLDTHICKVEVDTDPIPEVLVQPPAKSFLNFGQRDHIPEILLLSSDLGRILGIYGVKSQMPLGGQMSDYTVAIEPPKKPTDVLDFIQAVTRT